MTTNLFGNLSYVGVNDHFLAWSAPDTYPIPQIIALGGNVVRNDLPVTTTTSYPGVLGTAKCNDSVAGWANQLKSAGQTPMLVCTFDTLQDTAAMVAGISALVQAAPGMMIEWGNEISYWASAAPYVDQYYEVAAAAKAADPTCRIAPAPVANIDPGGSGWTFWSSLFAAGIAGAPMDFVSFHDYEWPSRLPPTTNWSNGQNSITLVPPFVARLRANGISAPAWITEFGWPLGVTAPARQAQYVVTWLSAVSHMDLQGVVGYELADGGGEAYGWMTPNWKAPRPVYNAVSKLIDPRWRFVQIDGAEAARAHAEGIQLYANSAELDAHGIPHAG